MECTDSTGFKHFCDFAVIDQPCSSATPTPTPPPEETPPPTQTPTPEPTPIDNCTCKPNPDCQCIPHANPGGPTVLSYECISCGPFPPTGSQPANYCEPTFTNGCPPGKFNNGSDCCVCNTPTGACPTPTPAPTPPPTTASSSCPGPTSPYPCGGGGSYCACPSYSWNSFACSWTCNPAPPNSPVLVDVSGDGFALTNAAGGVPFDLDGDGAAESLSWTGEGDDDAWLTLDRNGNGAIDSGQELFGNFTPQPAPAAGEEPNGFLALAVFDRPASGGNLDGVIDSRDAVFPGLRLWQDSDHDGVSGPGELHALPAHGVAGLELDYKESKRADRHGNQFRYRAKVRDAHGAQLGRWAWDVFLLRGQ